MARMAGPAALGLIQFCLPILRLCLILGTLGLPQTLARVVAEARARRDESEARAAMGWSLRATSAVAGVLACMLLLLAPLGRYLFPDARVVPLLRWLAPIIVCDCIATLLQANFQGRNRMWPTALAGIIGQGAKLMLSMILIARVACKGPGAMAGAALAATALSEFGALVLLLSMNGWPRIAGIPEQKQLLASSLPLMGDGLVFAVAGAVDVVIIPARLVAAGFPRGAVTSLMGEVWGMALPTLFLAMVVIWPIAHATLPVLADAAARGDRAELKRRIFLTYLAVGAVALVTTAVFLSFPGPIVTVLYARPSAAPYLRMLAWVACPIYLASIGGTFLIGLNQPGLLFRQSLVCAAIRSALIYVLTGLPHLGVAGAMIGISAGNSLLAMANIWGVRRYLRAFPRGGKKRPAVRV